jgi:hypothetical protein
LTESRPKQDKKKGKERVQDDGDEDDEEEETVRGDVSQSSDEEGVETKDDVEKSPPRADLSPLEQECAKVRAVLNANIGACHVKLVRKSSRTSSLISTFSRQEEWSEAVKACSEGCIRISLSLHPI